MRSRDGRFDRVYWRNEKYLARPLKSFNRFMWDWREKAVAEIDPHLLDVLYFTGKALRQNGGSSQLLLVSGYRTAKTNAYLKASRNSYHMKGMAADIRPSRGTLEALLSAVEGLRETPHVKLDGIGHYPDTNWVHVDTGPPRNWAD